MKILKPILIVLTVLNLVVISCSETNSSENHKTTKESPLFLGEWKLDKMVLDKEIVRANIFGNPTYTFNPDKTYVIHVSTQLEQGTWEQKGEKVILHTNNSEKITELYVKELTQQIFTYEIGEETISRVYLVR